MADNVNKQKLEEILRKYDENIRAVYSGVTKLEGNVTLKKAQRRTKIKELIVKEVTKDVD